MTENIHSQITEPLNHLLNNDLENKKASYQVCVVSDGPDHRKHFSLTSKPVVRIGRDETNDLVLTDRHVSRFHLELKLIDKKVRVWHRGSTPTALDGRPIIELETVSKEETEILIGQTRLRLLLGKRPYWEKLVGKSCVMAEAYQQILVAAERDKNVLILGETGVGKEVVAGLIHWLSRRFNAPYIAANCSVMRGENIESKLFGHEKGAFTGADKQHKGFFEQASGGALFLDEIGELPLALQPQFLRVLETDRDKGACQRVIQRMGGEENTPCNVRVITATNRNLEEEVRKGNFREDLFHRLNVLTVTVPPLRERKEDIPDLVHYFLQEESIQMSSAAMEKLEAHVWPGNVRELQGVLEKAIGKVGKNGIIEVPDIETSDRSSNTNGKSIAEETEAEAEKIHRVLNDCLRRNNHKKERAIEAASQILGVTPRTIRNKIKKYNLTCP